METQLVRLEHLIKELMSSYNIPSITIGIYKDGRTIYSKAFGFKDLENLIEADIETVYGIGSVTKTFTALSIMLLQEEGKLSIEDYVDKYVDLRIKPYGERIKIWHLLSHTSGIPALGYAEAYIDYHLLGRGKYFPISKDEDVLDFINEAENYALYKPGEKFLYLNEGYVILGMIIEKVSGLKYEEFVRKRIFENIGMSKTYVDREVLKENNLAVPYYIEGRKVKRGKLPLGIKADGGIYSNIPDLLKYAKSLMNREIASPRTMEEMERVRIENPFSYTGLPGEGYGLGLEIIPNFFGRRLIHHGGNVLVYTAFMGYIPEENMAIAVLSNTSSFPLSVIATYALTLMLGKEPEKELPYLKSLNLLNKLEGRYIGFKGTIEVKVKRVGGALMLKSMEEVSIATYEKTEVYEDREVHIFNIESLGKKLPIYFIEKKRDHELLLQYERYLLKKVA